jgi:hypothetical protein
MEIDGPSEFQEDLSPLAAFVQFHFHPVFELLAVETFRLAAEGVVRKTCDFYGGGQFDEYVAGSHWEHVMCIFAVDGEVIGGVACSGGCDLVGEVDVFDDEIVLRDVLYVFIAEHHVFVFVDAEGEVEDLLLSGLYLFAGRSSGF